jgi:hypothetical protein
MCYPRSQQFRRAVSFVNPNGLAASAKEEGPGQVDCRDLGAELPVFGGGGSRPSSLMLGGFVNWRSLSRIVRFKRAPHKFGKERYSQRGCDDRESQKINHGHLPDLLWVTP